MSKYDHINNRHGPGKQQVKQIQTPWLVRDLLNNGTNPLKDKGTFL